MARKKGKPAYPNKSKTGSYFMTREAHRKMKAAAKRTGKSDSDVIEHGIRETAEKITPLTPRFGPEGGADAKQA